MPLLGHGLRPAALRRRASRPQLKRGPLGSMQPSTSANQAEEPLRRTLARNVALAAGVGVVIALQRHRLRLALPIAALALWFSLGGHYVELAFLNGLRARISEGRLIHVGLRLVVWFAGGGVLYVLMAASARVLRLEALERSVQQLQQEQTETQERLDFAERLLSKAREERRISG